MFFSLFAVLICQRLGAVGRWPNPPKKKETFRDTTKKNTLNWRMRVVLKTFSRKVGNIFYIFEQKLQ